MGESMGVASGCGCKEVYRFLIPTPLVSVLFCSSIPTFCSFLNRYFFVITFYVLLNNFSHSINTHTGDYGHPTAAV